jgi:hypothetical protein
VFGFESDEDAKRAAEIIKRASAPARRKAAGKPARRR